MTRESPALLSRPAPVAAALLGLTLLDAVRDACGRLADGDDPEALHDFRVAVRRLRTLLRMFRDELGDAASKKLQRRLRELTRMTSAGRDGEVQLVWVRARKSQVARGSRAGLRWLLARLTARRDDAYASGRDEVMSTFRQVERRVRRALTDVADSAGTRRGVFAAAAARVIGADATALERELAAVRTTRDQDAIHRARIAVKRLRYLLEWMAGEAPQTGPIITRLRGLQDVLGELHDLHVFIGELGDALADAAAERARSLHARVLRGGSHPAAARRRTPAPGSAGLLALARLGGDEEEQLLRRLAAELDARGAQALIADLTALAHGFLNASRAAPRRPPRRLRFQQAPRAAV